MRDWIAKLDDFLRLSDRELLSHSGTISHEAALARAQSEYDKFHTIEAAKPQPVDAHFELAIEAGQEDRDCQDEAEAEEARGMTARLGRPRPYCPGMLPGG